MIRPSVVFFVSTKKVVTVNDQGLAKTPIVRIAETRNLVPCGLSSLGQNGFDVEYHGPHPGRSRTGTPKEQVAY
jgi:hypothetical protein